MGLRSKGGCRWHGNEKPPVREINNKNDTSRRVLKTARQSSLEAC